MRKKLYIFITALILMTVLVLAGGVYTLIKLEVFHQKPSQLSGTYIGDGEENVNLYYDGTMEVVVDGEVVTTKKVPTD